MGLMEGARIWDRQESARGLCWPNLDMKVQKFGDDLVTELRYTALVRLRALVAKVGIGMARMARALRRMVTPVPKFPPDDDSSSWPDAGKPSPLRPSPTHHLVAANGLPPSERTYLFAKD